MDFQYLLRILSGRKWIILSVAAAASILAFYMIGKKPQMYKAEVILSTGIVNYKGFNADKDGGFVQEYQIENSFSNLMEFCQSRSSIKLLTLKLLRHDLLADGGSSATKPFRQPNLALSNFSADEKMELLDGLRKVKLDSLIDPSLDARMDFLLDKVSRAYGYDHDQLRNALEIKRIGETDYLRVSFKSTDPQLTHFAANGFVSEFMEYYQNLRQQKNRADVDFFSRLRTEKRGQIDSFRTVINDYKFKKALPRLDEGGKSLYSQATDLELQLAEAQRKVQSSAQVSKKLEGYLAEGDRKLVNDRIDRVISKSETVELNKKIQDLNAASIRAGRKDKALEKELAESQKRYSDLLANEARGIGKSRLDEKTNREDDVFRQKVDSDIEAVNAQNSVSTITAKLSVLRGKLSNLVEDDAFTNTVMTDLERAEGEYTVLNNDYQSARLALESSRNPLTIIENAQLPEWPESNQRKLISVFSGIAAGTLATLAIFFLAFFDSAVRSPLLFKKAVAGLPFLGAVNAVGLRNLDLKALFATTFSKEKGHDIFRESLRKIRQLIEGSGGRIVLFVSPKKAEGKSFTINALAHSLAAGNKNVLVLDCNFKNPTLSQFAEEPSRLAPLINRLILEHDLSEVFAQKQNSVQFNLQNVDVLANRQPLSSPNELFAGKNFRRFLEELSGAYDFVLIDSPALNQFADARELVPFADRVVGVFSANHAIQSADQETLEFLQGLGSRYLGSLLTQVSLKNMN